MNPSNEQTYLCTLQISNQVGRCRNTTECLPQVGTDQKISFLSLQGQHEATVDASQMHPTWMKLIRCSCFKVRALIDPRSASSVPLYVRVYVIPQQIIAHLRNMQLLLEEEILQTCLEEYTFFIEMLDTQQDRTFRKQLRIANDRLREFKLSVDISDQTSEIASAMMRIRERVDFQLTTTTTPLMHTSIGQGTGLRQSWSTQTFERTTQNLSGPSSPLHLQCNDLSQTEASLCIAWKAACLDVLNKGPCATWFILPHVMFVYLDGEEVPAAWLSACEATQTTQAVSAHGLIPSEIMNVDIVFIQHSQLQGIQNAVQQTVQTMAFALHLQQDEEPKFFNEARMRKLQMSTAQKWTTDERAKIDAPLAWCMPGLIVHDRRGNAHSDWTPLLEPNVLIQKGSLDLNRSQKESPQASWSMFLQQPKRWLKCLKFKHVVVPPDVVHVRMSQVSSQPGMSEKIRRLGPDNLAVRGNLYAFVSPSQSQTLVQNHFDVCSLTIGQMLTSNPTNLRRRSIEDDAKTCSICFEKISDATGYWNTLCSHSQCTTCGPIAFRHWTPTHNAAHVLVDCPACRTPLSSFDTLRIREGPDQRPKDSIAEAIETETKNLPKRTNVFQILNMLERPSESWYTTVPKSVHTLIVTDVASEWIQEWSSQMLLWAVHSKKNAKLTLIQNPGHRPSQALANLLDA